MRLRVGLALVLSLILVSGAGASRFFSKTDSQAAIELINTEEFLAAVNANPENTADLGAAAATTTPEVLTTTDLISRQLFGDYIDLAASDAATPENINKLAGNYADAIVKMAQQSHISAIDLNIVPVTEATITAYYTWIATNSVKYQEMVEMEFMKADQGTEITDSGLKTVGLKVSSLYKEEAELFKTAPVPQNLVTDHLGLTNTYYNNAAAYQAIAESGTEPIGAIAGLAAVNQNDAAEALHLENIAKILSSSGIILRSQ